MELKTIALTKKFGGRIAVNDLNLTFTNGVYGLLGANGAGKTTFMRLSTYQVAEANALFRVKPCCGLVQN